MKSGQRLHGEIILRDYRNTQSVFLTGIETRESVAVSKRQHSFSNNLT